MRSAGCGAQVQSQAGDFDIPSYGHQEVDRCGVLMDAWAQHAAFLECKKEVSLYEISGQRRRVGTADLNAMITLTASSVIQYVMVTYLSAAGLLPGGVPARVRPRREAATGAGHHQHHALPPAHRPSERLLRALLPPRVHLPASAHAARQEHTQHAGASPVRLTVAWLDVRHVFMQ